MKSLLSIALLAGALGMQAAATATDAPQEHVSVAPPVVVAQATAGPNAADAEASAAAEDMRAALAADLREIIGRPGWSGDEWSVMVRSLDRGDTLFSHGGETPLAP
ncbi:MAG TPA: hypothetical protein VHG09_03200, partial [Longimicrobiales bacterium]|nr:hypothetical protein [Longimicrobiales bacterium]